MVDKPVFERIKQQLDAHPIVLYMKGTAQFPQCGFSAKAVQILRACHADFFAVNVLDDMEIREGIKKYGDWPTIPQLYIKGVLIGGSDIISDLYDRGELQEMIADLQKS